MGSIVLKVFPLDGARGGARFAWGLFTKIKRGDRRARAFQNPDSERKSPWKALSRNLSFFGFERKRAHENFDCF